MVTVTVTDAGGAANSVTFTWTIAGACNGNQFTNSGFESGRTGWTMATNRVYRSSTAHRGTHLTRLDGYGRTHTDRVVARRDRSRPVAGRPCATTCG